MKRPTQAIKTWQELEALPVGTVIYAVIPGPTATGSCAYIERSIADGSTVIVNGRAPNGWGVKHSPLSIPFGGGRTGYYFTNYWYAVAYMLQFNGGENGKS